MKIAFCFCGHVRTGEYAADNILHYIGNLLPNVDFFMHTWSNNEYKALDPKSINMIKRCEEKNCTYDQLPRSLRFPSHIAPDTMYVIGKMQEKYKTKFKKIEIEPYDFYEFRKKVETKFSPHWYSWVRSNSLKKEFEEQLNFKYDIVLKTRPDAIFHLNDNLQKDIDYCLNNSINENIFVQDDVLHIGTSAVMDAGTDIIMSKTHKDLTRNTWVTELKNIGIGYKKLATLHHGIYRPESIPESSLKFVKCFNLSHDWYRPANWISAFKDDRDIEG